MQMQFGFFCPTLLRYLVEIEGGNYVVKLVKIRPTAELLSPREYFCIHLPAYLTPHVMSDII